MIFSSPTFIFLFLPITLLGYFLLNKARWMVGGKVWLVAASVFFYGYWDLAYVPLLLGSIGLNFLVGRRFARSAAGAPNLRGRRWLLAASIAANLLLLGYFKYANFLVANLDALTQGHHALPQIVLPLGISFFTFTQIAYLVDSYRGEVREYSAINYALFVTFFPHLIAGPILHHREMMPQFASRWRLVLRWRNVLLGLLIFGMGLFKKVVLADTLAPWADAGFDGGERLDFFSAWATSLSYAFQLYFDFSGYCDMAMGAALLFNIWLPLNFNSPYKALDIQDFWRRWHMTLSRYLRDYLYVPLGGNRAGEPRIYLNLFATFLLGGLWHGASWTFVIWGALHGAAVALHRFWRDSGWRMPRAAAWALTFLFVNASWVFFRAKTFDDAFRVLSGMADLSSAVHLPVSGIATAKLAWSGWLGDELLRVLPHGVAANALSLGAVLLAFVIVRQQNSVQWMNRGVSRASVATGVGLFCASVYCMLMTKSSVFLYFNF